MKRAENPTHRTSRISLAAIATAAVALLLSGCASSAPGGSAPDDRTNSAEAAGGDSALAGSLSIAAAASLEPAFRELAGRFTEANPGVTIENLTFDGSSALAEQINRGAPFDVFASADEKNMARVEDLGLTADVPIAFATSSLEIAVAPGNPLGIKTLADLADPDRVDAGLVVVICAPEVPCGAASHTLLDRDGVDLEPASEEQNVTAVLQKVASGEADAGLVYRSDVLRSEGAVEGIEIAGSIEAAGTYLIAPLKDSKPLDAARAFVEFVHSDGARALFDELGFGPA